MSRNKCKEAIEDIRRVVAEFGGVVEIDDARNHPRIDIRLGAQTRRMFMAGSPSDWRSHKNKLAEIKRVLRDMRSLLPAQPAAE